MTKTRTFALLPVWAIALAALLMLFALRAQIAQTLPFTTPGHHVSAPQLGPGPMNAPAVGNQPSSAQGGSSSVITRTGTTSPQAGAAPQPGTTNQAATSNDHNSPCYQVGKGTAMCPVSSGP